MPEFSIIKKFFQRETKDADLIVPSGDDCAVVNIPNGFQLALSIDTMVLGTHFTEANKPYDVAYKAVTSTLSDLAAMGAEPKWLTGSLTLPDENEAWLSEFSNGLYAAVDKYKLNLIGGDVTRGPLNITFQAHGLVPNGKAIKRSSAKSGDLIYVTNTLGDAAYGLTLPEGNVAQNRPEAQIAAGSAMREFATSCIDISDGLLQDLQHVLTACNVGAKLITGDIPLSDDVKKLDPQQTLQYALAGGEDYQLLITLPANKRQEFEKAMPVSVTCIGEITAEKDLQVLTKEGRLFPIEKTGYQHF